MSPPPSSIQLRSATQADLPQIVSLQFECFSQAVLIERLANPNTPENRQAMLIRHRQHMAEDPGCKVVVAVTPGQGNEEKIVGFCMFYYPIVSEGGEVVLPIPLRPPPPSPEGGSASIGTAKDQATSQSISVATIPLSGPQPASSDPTPISLSQTNIATLLPYRHNLVKSLLSTAPGGAGYVRYMSVSSSYRRSGIGQALMDWGCSRFDEAGVPVYLEATADGEKLYNKYGFERVGEQVLKVYGGDGVEVTQEERCACMWRKAKKEQESV